MTASISIGHPGSCQRDSVCASRNKPAGRFDGRTSHFSFLQVTAHLLTVIVISAVLTGCGPRRTKQGSSPSTDGQSTVGADSEAGSDDGPDVHRTRPTSESRAIDGRFFGYNAASIVQPVNVELMFDPALTTELAKFPVDLIRIPSGTARAIHALSGRIG